MKILLVNDYGFPLGGAESYVLWLREALTQRGHTVRLVSSDRERNGKKVLADYTLPHSGHFWNLDSWFNWKAYKAFKKILSIEKPDVVHFNNIFYTLSAAVCFAAKGVHSVLTIHDYQAICLRDKTLADGEICCQALKSCKKGCLAETGAAFAVLKRQLMQSSIARTRIRISPSRYLQSEFERNGIKNVTVVPHPVFTQGASKSPQESKDFLFLGRLEKQKGVKVLLEAFAEVAKKYREPRLIIAGDGRERLRLEGMVETYSLEDRVKFLGWVDEAEKQKLFSASFCLVQPAIWPEVAGLGLYEAAAWGIPCIASKVGGIPEFLEHEETGLLVDYGNVAQLHQAMCRFLERPEDALRFAEAAKASCNTLSESDHLLRLEQLYTV